MHPDLARLLTIVSCPDGRLPVIPLKPNGKTPLVKWERYQAQPPTIEQVEAWAEQHQGCNWGLLTGRVSGVVVLDADDLPQLSKYLKAHRLRLPECLRVQTSPGKWHYYLVWPGREVRNFARAIPGLDFRGDGGYVVCPPSTHPSGSGYAWHGLDLGLGPWEEWVDRLFQDNGEPARAVNRPTITEADLAGGITEGQRNDHIFHQALKLLYQGMDINETAALMRSLNLTQCSPPLDAAEVIRIVESAHDHADRRKTAAAAAAGQAEGVVDEDTRRETVRKLFSSLGLPEISEVYRQYSETTEYFFQHEDGREGSISAESLTIFNQFRARLFGLTNKMALHLAGKDDKGWWPRICGVIGRIAVEREYDPAATLQGELEELIANYLMSYPPEPTPSQARCTYQGGFLPYLADEAVVISEAHLRRFASDVMSPDLRRRLRSRLRLAGGERVTVRVGPEKKQLRGVILPPGHPSTKKPPAKTFE